MLRTAPRSLLVLAILVVSSLAVPAGFATDPPWTPPPPEFPELSAGRLLMADQKWDPSLGAPTSLLDLLPSGSPAAADFDRNGYMDIFVPSSRYTEDALNMLRAPKSHLFMNNRGTTYNYDDKFLDVTDVSGVDVAGFAYAASWADYDNDGWEDLFVGGYHLAKLFHNLGDSRFTEVTAAAGLPQDGLVLGGAWGDYDADGKVDLFLAQFSSYTHAADGLPNADFSDVAGKANVLLHNNGDGTFGDVTAAAGVGAETRRSTGAAFVDVDNDGRPDIYVTNYGQSSELWRNNGDGTFTNEAEELGLADGQGATCQAWEDFDRDGRLDVYVPHQAGVADGLFLQQPDGTFVDVQGTVGLGVTSAGRGWGCAALDYDNDGDFDMFVAQSDVTGPLAQKPQLLTNRLDEHNGLMFRDDTDEAGDHDAPTYATLDTIASSRAASGAAVVDWDLDTNSGAVDLVTTNNGDLLRMFKNVGYDTGWIGGNGNFLKILLKGVASNRDGIGAKVTVTVGNLSYTRVAGAGMSWGGQSRTELHYGLWKALEAGYTGVAKPVNITVGWPSGTVDVYTNLLEAGGAYITLTEGGTWRVDSCSPSPVLTLTSGTLGENNWHTSGSVTYQLRAFEKVCGNSPKSVVQYLKYSLDGSTWTTVAAPGTGVTLPTFSGEGTRSLWVDTSDTVGNRAVFQFPIRIDTLAPEGTLLSPAPGSLYAQGHEVAKLGDPAGLNRAVVVAPSPLDFAGMGDADAALNGVAGSDGTQAVAADASDAGSGILEVRFAFSRSTGQPVGSEVSVPWYRAPYVYHWLVASMPAGEYKITTTIVDHAGLQRSLLNKVLVVPSTPAGILATLPVVGQGPSVPTIG